MKAQATSAQAFADIKREGIPSRQQSMILAHIQPGRDYSLQELARLAGFQINAVSARCNELRNGGAIEFGPQRKCAITGRTVNPVRLPAQKQAA